MSYDEYESLKETLDILSDKKLMRKIKKGLKEEKKGKLLTHSEVFGDEI